MYNTLPVVNLIFNDGTEDGKLNINDDHRNFITVTFTPGTGYNKNDAGVQDMVVAAYNDFLGGDLTWNQFDSSYSNMESIKSTLAATIQTYTTERFEVSDASWVIRYTPVAGSSEDTIEFGSGTGDSFTAQINDPTPTQRMIRDMIREMIHHTYVNGKNRSDHVAASGTVATVRTRLNISVLEHSTHGSYAIGTDVSITNSAFTMVD
jgi:hypothetical protein